jgi:hypothetical protein
VIQASASTKASRCTEGGREVECLQGPHCTEGGRLVPCKKGDPLPATHPPATTQATTTQPATTASKPTALAATVAGAGSAEPPRAGSSGLEIATSVAHAVAYVDGAPVQDAPCVLELEPGEHVVAVYAAGMVPAETIVRVDAAKRQRVELNPSQPRRRIDVPAQ